VLDQHKRHAGIGRHMVEKCRERFQPACRCSYADYREKLLRLGCCGLLGAFVGAFCGLWMFLRLRRSPGGPCRMFQSPPDFFCHYLFPYRRRQTVAARV
jgi:hypothetical protein